MVTEAWRDQIETLLDQTPMLYTDNQVETDKQMTVEMKILANSMLQNSISEISTRSETRH